MTSFNIRKINLITVQVSNFQIHVPVPFWKYSAFHRFGHANLLMLVLFKLEPIFDAVSALSKFDTKK